MGQHGYKGHFICPPSQNLFLLLGDWSLIPDWLFHYILSLCIWYRKDTSQDTTSRDDSSLAWANWHIPSLYPPHCLATWLFQRVLYKHPEPSRFKEALLKFLKSRTPPPLSQRRPKVAQQTIGNPRMEPILWKAEGNNWVRNGVIVWPCVSHILAVDDSFGVLGFNKIVFDNTEHPNKHNHLEPMIIFSLHAWRWRHWYLSQKTAGKI